MANLMMLVLVASATLGAGFAPRAAVLRHVSARVAPRLAAPTYAPLPDAINTKLLCASVLAQSIQPNGTATNPGDNYVAGARATGVLSPPKERGFLHEPTVIQGGIDNNDACLVGTTSDGVVVAFRGTVTRPDTNYSDWMSDLYLFLAQPAGWTGRVHTGFYSAVANLWSKDQLWTSSKRLWLYKQWLARFVFKRPAYDPAAWLADEIKTQLDKAPTKAIYITGHSKGGGMCPQCAVLVDRASDLPSPTAVVTWASPNPGNPNFAEYYDALSFPQYSFENYDDVVSLVPHQLFEYITARPDCFDEHPGSDAALTKFFSKPELLDTIAQYKPNSDYKPLGFSLFADAKDRYNYAPVGERIVIEARGKRTTPDDAPDDTRVAYILEQLGNRTAGSDDISDALGDAVGYLFFTHCKECSAKECQGRYMAGARADPTVCRG